MGLGGVWQKEEWDKRGVTEGEMGLRGVWQKEEWDKSVQCFWVA